MREFATAAPESPVRVVRAAAMLVAAALFACAPWATAQTWPAKPVKLVVGFGPGGVADITARVVAQKLSQDLGQQFVVDNRPSAGGIVAAEAVAKAEPDGYTLLLMSNGNAVSASLFKSLPYDTVADFAPVSTLGFFDVAVVTTPDTKIDSLQGLIARAKANPGKLNIGTINIGSTQHLSAELFKSMAGIDAETVPYKGSPAVISALRGNDVEIAFEMLAPIIPQAQSGAVKILAVTPTGARRCCPTCPRWPRAVSRATRRRRGTPSPRRRARHARSSTACTRRLPRHSPRRR